MIPRVLALAVLFCILLLAGCATWRDEARAAIDRGDQVTACRLAAQNQDDPVALLVLGACSEQGVLEAQDMTAAIGYYTLAARYGVPKAAAQLARLGQPVPAPDLMARPQPSLLQSFGAGMQGAGAILSPDVYNSQRGLPPPQPEIAPLLKQLDYPCLQRCTNAGSTYGYCASLCSY